MCLWPLANKQRKYRQTSNLITGIKNRIVAEQKPDKRVQENCKSSQ